MALLPNYSPFFKYRGSHDIYSLGYNTHYYDWTKGEGTTDYIAHFIYNPQSTNGSTGKIIKGDFCLHGVASWNTKYVAGFSVEGSWGIQVKLWCHDRRLGTDPTKSNQWVDRTSSLRITPNNTCIKMNTYWNTETFQSGRPIYGISIHKNGEHVTYDTSQLVGMSATAIIDKLKSEGYHGNRGFDHDPFYLPELVAYRYQSNNGSWSPSSSHITPFYRGIVNISYNSHTRSNTKKSTVDGGGGNELEYKFIFDKNNGVGLDYFRLQFIVEGMSWFFPEKPIFADYNKIDNPMLSVPDFCNRSDIVNWPDRFDAMSYYYDGSWKKSIPLFKFYDGSNWVCF